MKERDVFYNTMAHDGWAGASGDDSGAHVLRWSYTNWRSEAPSCHLSGFSFISSGAMCGNGAIQRHMVGLPGVVGGLQPPCTRGRTQPVVHATRLR